MAQGSALTRNDIPHGSKNWLQRAILYRHKRYKCVREDCRQYQGETMYIFCDGYLMISLDQCIRLGWRLVWYKILSVCFHGLQRDHPENPYEKD